MFTKMTTKDLRRYIDACHASRTFDSYFESACREYNGRVPAPRDVSYVVDQFGTVKLQNQIRVY